MLDGLRQFIADVVSPHAPARSFDDTGYQLAATALLIHVVSLDGEPSEVEKRKLHSLIESRFGLDRGTADLVVKIGIHEGPCLAVMLNERQDYFGQTVNIAARVQSLSTAQEIHITSPVLDAPAVAEVLKQREIRPIQKQAALRGIADKMVVYEIP